MRWSGAAPSSTVTAPGGGWNESVLYKFLGGTDGADPDVTLIVDGAGIFMARPR